ncbi:MAG TPA: PEGA domain-containing protein [Planctomycetota bacterium]|nr:PEGA domain-containing protein [Planctomycetota bacterium]
MIYATAFLAIGVFGWLVARPYLLLHSFRGDLETVSRLLDSVPPGTSPVTFDGLRQVGDEVIKMEEQAKRLGNTTSATEARISLNDFNARLITARITAAEASIKEINTAVAHGDVVRAEQILTSLRPQEYRDSLGARFKVIEDEVAVARKKTSDIEAQRRQASERLAQAEELEKTGNLAGALISYRQLVGLGHETASPTAKEGIARLEPKEQAFITGLSKAQELAGKDLAKADAALAAIANDAKAWGRAGEVTATRAEVAKRIQTAATAYQQLGANPNADALSAFIAANAASPQAAQAKARLDLFAQAQRSRVEQMNAWRAAMQTEQTEQAWRIARNLYAGGGELPAELQLPIRIETAPAGAQVLIDGKAAGTTPCVITVRPEQTALDVRLIMDGWQPTSRKVGDIAGEWRWQASMSRTAKWQVNLGKPVSSVMALPDGGVFALSGEVLHRIGADGKSQWRTSIAALDDLSDIERLRLAHLPQVLADGSLLMGLPNKDVGLISAKKGIDSRLPSVEPVRGRPQVYNNDLLGGHPRLAYAAEALYIGDVGMEVSRIALPSAALSGPLTFPKGPDRILVVATIQGQLLAFEESTKQRLWQFDLKATEIGQLIPLGGDAAMGILDGSRVASWRISPTGATLRWNTALPGPAVGEPALAGNQIWIATGNALVRLSFDGVASTLPLPSPAITAAAAGGDLTAVGVRSSQVLVYKRNTLLWATRCESLPGAVACTGDVVVVGMADGTVATYSP